MQVGYEESGRRTVTLQNGFSIKRDSPIVNRIFAMLDAADDIEVFRLTGLWSGHTVASLQFWKATLQTGRDRMRFSPYSGLGTGVLFLSEAAILIRLAEAPSFVIAAYRLALAGIYMALREEGRRHA